MGEALTKSRKSSADWGGDIVAVDVLNLGGENLVAPYRKDAPAAADCKVDVSVLDDVKTSRRRLSRLI